MRVLRVSRATLSRAFETRAFRLWLSAFMLAAAVAGASLFSGHAQSAGPLPASASAATPAPVAAPPANQPVANAGSTDPKAQIAQLLQMATDLKTEVDKSNKDELSMAVVRKASALEQLAHKVRNTWPASSR